MYRRDFLRSFAAAPAVLSAQTGASRRPNIVLIYGDDIGYGDVSSYGATRVRTPHLDRLVASGIRFTNAHSTSATCTPSRYSMLTGEYAWRRKGTGVLPGDASLIIDPGRPTLASMLRQQGYTTGVVGKWHLGLGTGKLDWNGDIKPGPLEIGFDYCFVIPATGDRVPCVYVENHRVVGLDPGEPITVTYDQPIPGEPLGRTHPQLLRMHPSHGHDMAIVNGVSRIGYMKGGKSALWIDEDMADTITKKAAEFIGRNRTKPFFLYFATHDIHVPRLPHRRFAGKTPMGPRGDAIAELDWSVGQVLDALERNGLTRNTLVMFSSDNGPVVDDGYRDEAVEKLGDHRPAGPLRGGKYSKFEGGTRVPLLVRWPAGIRKRGTSDALVSQVDLYASLAQLTRHALPPEAAPDSFDILPALLGRSKTGRDYAIEHAGSLAVIQGDWKFIAPNKGPAVNRNTNTETGNAPEAQLYNLRTDPAEKNNLATQYRDRVTAMDALLERVRSEGRTRLPR
ncbi:MAG TPA: arylsulfatase [Bryobacteraceae bacterium]|nr:arylsulfatase [Bryobacteraceae bacterium]